MPCNSRSFAHKESWRWCRAYVAAGAEVVGGVDEATDFDVFLDFFHDVQGVFVSVCVGDSDDLFFRFHDVIADEGDQLVQGGFATTAFFILDDVCRRLFPRRIGFDAQ